MTDRPKADDRPPVPAYPLRDWLALEVMTPAQSGLVDRLLDRIAAERRP